MKIDKVTPVFGNHSMKNNKVFGPLSVALASLLGALLSIPGCGAAGSSPEGLANKALAPANGPEEEKAQERAIIDLASLPPNTPGQKEALRRVLKESDKPKIRVQAIYALGNMLQDKDSVPLLIERVKSDDVNERRSAAVYVGK